MAPIGCLHAGWVDRLARLFFNQTGDEITVRVQNPLHLSHFSEPEPDLALLRPRATPYTEAHPTPEDVLLLVEVADTSIGYDRDRKIPLYARYAIPEVWLLDLNKPELTIYLAPSASGYRTIQRPEKTAAISPSRLPGVSLTLDRDLFG